MRNLTGLCLQRTMNDLCLKFKRQQNLSGLKNYKPDRFFSNNVHLLL